MEGKVLMFMVEKTEDEVDTGTEKKRGKNHT
jgi:hypothetical protein